MFENLCEKILKKYNLQYNDRPVHFENVFNDPSILANWTTIENCINFPAMYEFELIDFHNQKIEIPRYRKMWNSIKTVQDKEFVFNKFMQGYGLIITNYDNNNEYINNLLRCFENFFDVYTDAHLYCGLKNANSFSIHEDYPSNFIVQIDGTTHWKVFKNRISSVYRTGLMNNLLKEDQLETVLDVTLNPGDMLYIPARAYHCAQPCNERISISIPCWSRTLADDPALQNDRNIYRIN